MRLKSMSKQTMLFLDRFESDYAVLIDPSTNCSCDMPREWLPDDVLEGSYILLTIVPDNDRTRQERSKSADIIRSLKRDSE